MDKDLIIEFGIKIAANHLDIDPVDYAIDYDGVLKEINLSGIYIPIKNLIIINSNWLENSNNNDILLLVFHEMRHYYQKKQIDLLNKGLVTREDIDKVKVWKEEFEKYKSPFKTNCDDYIEQEIEKDAIDFSRNLLERVQRL